MASQQSSHSSSSSSISAAASSSSNVNPSASLVVRGRNRELQQLNNEIQLLEEELRSLDNVALASKACEDFMAFVESRADPFFPKRKRDIFEARKHFKHQKSRQGRLSCGRIVVGLGAQGVV